MRDTELELKESNLVFCI